MCVSTPSRPAPGASRRRPLRVAAAALLLATVLLAAGAGIAPAQAQDAPAASIDTMEARMLSLNEALTTARTGSFPVRTAAAETRAVRARKAQSLAVFLPQVTLSEQATATTDPVNAFGLTLKQERFTQSDFQIGALNDPERVDNFTTQVEVRQPVLNLDGLFERRAAADAVRAARHKGDRTRAVVTFQVKTGYFGLVLADRQLDVIHRALRAARANRDQAEALHNQGIINRADLLAARVRVLDLESRRTDARARRQSASDRLRFLLGLDDPVPLVPTDSLVQADAPAVTVNLDRVNRTRSDMQALRFRADAAREQTRARWTAFVPTLNARGTYGWHDDSPFGTAGSGWTAGASLSWSLFEGYRQVGRAQQAEAEQQQAEIALQQQALKNRVEMAEALRDLRAARERIAQSRAAVEQAGESLRIRRDRYAEGLARTTDLLQAEATLAERRLAALQALYEHNLAVYRLELLTERDMTDGAS